MAFQFVLWCSLVSYHSPSLAGWAVVFPFCCICHCINFWYLRQFHSKLSAAHSRLFLMHPGHPNIQAFKHRSIPHPKPNPNSSETKRNETEARQYGHGLLLARMRTRWGMGLVGTTSEVDFFRLSARLAFISQFPFFYCGLAEGFRLYLFVCLLLGTEHVLICRTIILYQVLALNTAHILRLQLRLQLNINFRFYFKSIVENYDPQKCTGESIQIALLRPHGIPFFPNLVLCIICSVHFGHCVLPDAKH